MRRLSRYGRYGLHGASAVALVACAQIAGISQYESTEGTPDGRAPVTGVDAMVVVDAGDDVAEILPDGATESSVPMSYACSRGGCDTATRSCAAAGRCYCATDNDCTHGKCVAVPGLNDVSCGTNCTGTGPVDGFNCTLSCVSGVFSYAPSNFSAAAFSPPAAATTDCNATYDSGAHRFTVGSCAGQVPMITGNFPQTGGHTVDVLVFKSLTIAGTLTLVGSNPVILAVYGDATIRGTIDASANGSTPGAGGNNCSSASTGSAGSSGLWETGASGGAQSASGGAGGASKGSLGAPASSPQTTAAVPLTGGCAGSAPFTSALGFVPSVGAGGGGVQISAAGYLDISSGTIKANGSNGGNGEIGKCNDLSNPSQNGTGGAGAGSGGTILVEGSPVMGGTYQAAGGKGGSGGPAPAPSSQSGGAGGAGGAPGASGAKGGDGTQVNPPPGCAGETWSGGGGGGGGGGTVKTNQGTACLCAKDADCTSGHCSNVSRQCSGTCTGDTSDGAYDSEDCQVVTTTSRAL